MICASLDRDLRQFAQSIGIRYTRYADDITFSSKNGPFPESLVSVRYVLGQRVVRVGTTLDALLAKNSFAVNPSKVRLRSRRDRQEVTGLTVNVHLNVDRRYVRTIRAMLHAWRTFGYNAAEAEYRARFNRRHRRNPDVQFWAVVLGKLEHLKHVRGADDPVVVNLKNQLAECDPGRYPAIAVRSSDLERCLWVVEVSAGSQHRRGTAFDLKGVGVVTAAHCLQGEEACLYRRQAPMVRYHVEITHWSDPSARDLAVLRVPDTGTARWSLQRATRPAATGDTIHMIGYPLDATLATWEQGRVIREVTNNEVVSLETNFTIHHGASGSPVLDEDLAAVGVAIWSDYLPAAPGARPTRSSAVSIGAIDGLPPYTGPAHPLLLP